MDKIDEKIERALLGDKYEEFVALRKQYLKSLGEVRKHLEDNPLTKIYEAYTRTSITIDDLGSMLIKESLPSLSDLRQLAKEMEIDISDLGRSRIKIFDRLKKKEMGLTISPTNHKKEEVKVVKNKDRKKAQTEKTKSPHTNEFIEIQPKVQEKNEDEFNFLEDDFEEEEEETSEKELLEQMISLGSRGGKLTKLAESVNLDNIIE